MKQNYLVAAIVAASVSLVGCGSDDSGSDDNNPASQASSSSESSSTTSSSTPAVTTAYSFTNAAGESTVSYTGQIARHAMIADIKKIVGELQPNDVDAVAKVRTLYENPENSIDGDAIEFIGGFTSEQTTFADISTGKNLIGKIAGGYLVDDVPTGETTRLIGDEFFGWSSWSGADSTPAAPLPHDLVEHIMAQLSALTNAESYPDIMTEAGVANLSGEGKVYIDAYGVDYQQLLQKFLLMSVGFSQGATDYLGRDFTAEGELMMAEGKTWTVGEHHFDEGFGYFGAAQDYLSLSLDEISAAYNDSDGNGEIDLTREYNFGQSINCAKREAAAPVATQFTSTVMQAFIDGRGLVAQMALAKDDAEQLATLKTQLDEEIKVATQTWEKCISSTVIHYINDTLDDMSQFKGDAFADVANFVTLAKHWAEMKGFALGLQFNPNSPFRLGENDTDLEDLKEVLRLMGDAPVLPDGTQNGIAFDGGVAQYEMDLMAARDILEKAYAFNPANVAAW